MKLYCQLQEGGTRLSWDVDKESGTGGVGWYEIEREPDFTSEHLEYDEQNDRVVIKKREKSIEQLEAERQAAIKQQLVADLPDIILQNKDNPEALAQALCVRAKEIEVTNDLRTA